MQGHPPYIRVALEDPWYRKFKEVCRTEGGPATEKRTSSDVEKKASIWHQYSGCLQGVTIHGHIRENPSSIWSHVPNASEPLSLSVSLIGVIPSRISPQLSSAQLRGVVRLCLLTSAETPEEEPGTKKQRRNAAGSRDLGTATVTCGKRLLSPFKKEQRDQKKGRDPRSPYLAIHSRFPSIVFFLFRVVKVANSFSFPFPLFSILLSVSFFFAFLIRGRFVRFV